MSKCLHRNRSFLEAISKCSDDDRKNVIEKATHDQINSLTEIAQNILSGNFPLHDKRLKKLKKHKHSIRKLSKKTLSHTVKKKFLKQKGGFLPFLVAPVLSALGAIAGRVIGSQLGL